MSLRDALVPVLARAGEVFAGTDGAAEVADIARRLDEPLRVAIAGKVKSGKSTLLNALVGEQLAPTDAGECTKVVWWFRDGITYRVTLHPRQGEPVASRFRRDDGALEVDLNGIDPVDVDRLDVEWPSRALQTMTLIDTPGVASATATFADAARDFLAPDSGNRPADAVIYLMRHVHAVDVRFLEAFRDDDHGAATPVNSVAVLSRADEMGAGRLDAMVSAGHIADRYRRDPRLQRLCQAVVPVAGLLAQAAVTLREAEYRVVRRLAELDDAELDELLFSVDRFTMRPAPVGPGERVALLQRFGLFGVRAAFAAVRGGEGGSATQLAGTLLQASGVDRLRDLLADQFTARRDLLKGRAAILGLSALAERMPVAGTEQIESEIERILVSTHEFTEIRMLDVLRTAGLPLADADAAEAVRVLGGEGASAAARFGPEPAADVLARWQRRAENPLTRREVVELARAVVRTCEGFV